MVLHIISVYERTEAGEREIAALSDKFRTDMGTAYGRRSI